MVLKRLAIAGVLLTAPALVASPTPEPRPRALVEPELVVSPVATTSSTTTVVVEDTEPSHGTVSSTTAVARALVRRRPVAASPSQPQSAPCGRWLELIAAHFPADQVRKACAVVWCESKGNPTAQNGESSASGLWQFLDKTWRAVTGRSDRAYQASPDVQTAAAAKYWRQRGWVKGAWSCV